MYSRKNQQKNIKRRESQEKAEIEEKLALEKASEDQKVLEKNNEICEQQLSQLKEDTLIFESKRNIIRLQKQKVEQEAKIAKEKAAQELKI